MTTTASKATIARFVAAMKSGRRAELAVATGLSVSALEKCMKDKRLPSNRLVRAALLKAVGK